MSNRWSPTVVAEAPPPVQSALGRALGVGYGIYRDRQVDRRRQQALDLEERRHQDEVDYRDLQDQREMAAAQQAAQVAAFQRRQYMIEHGYSPDAPPDDRGGATPPSEDPIGPDNPAWEPSSPPPPLRAGNTGPGGASSEAQPQWYMARRQAIKDEAARRYPGSGTVMQRDPATGQTFYLPVRRNWEDGEIAKLDAEAKELREKAAQAAVWKNQEDYKQKLSLERIVATGDQTRRTAQVRAGLSGSGDEVDDEFDRELRGVGAEIDDLRTGANMDMSMASMQDRAGNSEARVAAQNSATERAGRLRAAESRKAAMVSGGIEGFRDSKTRKAAGEGATAIFNELGPDLQRMLNDPTIPAAQKAAMMAEVQARVDASTAGARKKYAPRKSGLGRAM